MNKCFVSCGTYIKQFGVWALLDIDSGTLKLNLGIVTDVSRRRFLTFLLIIIAAPLLIVLLIGLVLCKWQRLRSENIGARVASTCSEQTPTGRFSKE